MTKRKQADIGPRNAREAVIFAEERFVIDVQCGIQKLMRVKGMSERKLRKRLKLSKKRMRRIFDHRADISIRLLARIYHALGEDCRVGTDEAQVIMLRDITRGRAKQEILAYYC